MPCIAPVIALAMQKLGFIGPYFTRHVTVVMQLANIPDILDRSIFRDIARSAGPILHDMDRTLTPSVQFKKWKRIVGSLASSLPAIMYM